MHAQAIAIPFAACLALVLVIGLFPEKQGTLFFVSMSSAKRARVVVAVVVCVAAAGAALLVYRWRRPLAGPSAGSAPSILSQLPQGAPAVAYIDVAALRRLHDSPLASILGLAGENPAHDRDYQEFVRETGFDYTRDLDRVAIAFWPAAMQGGENRALAVADGRFDHDKIKAYALRTGRQVAQGKGSYYEMPGDPPISLEFQSATRIVLSSGKGWSVVTLVPSAAEKAAMQERINRVAGAPLFAVARTDNLPASFYDPLRSAPQFESVARSIQGLTLAGQPDGDILHVTLDAECDSMKNAIELATVVESLRLLGSMALADPKARAQMTKEQLALLGPLLNEAKLTHQDRIVRLTLDVTPEMLGSPSGNHAELNLRHAIPQGLKPTAAIAADVGAKAPTP
jgi:hypothetical protein